MGGLKCITYACHSCRHRILIAPKLSIHIDETTLNICVCLPVCLDTSLANRCTKSYSWAKGRQKEPNARKLTHPTTKTLSEDGELDGQRIHVSFAHKRSPSTNTSGGSQMYVYGKLHNSQSESRIFCFSSISIWISCVTTAQHEPSKNQWNVQSVRKTACRVGDLLPFLHPHSS